MPAQLIRGDGKHSEVYPNDKLFPLLGEEIAPSIEMVPALLLDADRKYIFYGNGIQVNDAVAQYNRLKIELSNYAEEKRYLEMSNASKQLETKDTNKLGLPNIAVPKIEIPKVEIPKLGNPFAKKTKTDSEE